MNKDELLETKEEQKGTLPLKAGNYTVKHKF
jgi:hypothetical protein